MKSCCRGEQNIMWRRNALSQCLRSSQEKKYILRRKEEYNIKKKRVGMMSHPMQLHWSPNAILTTGSRSQCSE